MNAMILYDEPELAAHANTMLTLAANRARAAVPWSVSLWRLDELMRRPTAAGALREAASAHLIVIAIRNQADLPLELLSWLEKWAAHRQVHDAALAVFDGKKGDMLSAPLSPALARFAGHHGLCFIVGDVNPDEDEAAAFLKPDHGPILEPSESARPRAIKAKVG